MSEAAAFYSVNTRPYSDDGPNGRLACFAFSLPQKPLILSFLLRFLMPVRPCAASIRPGRRGGWPGRAGDALAMGAHLCPFPFLLREGVRKKREWFEGRLRPLLTNWGPSVIGRSALGVSSSR